MKHSTPLFVRLAALAAFLPALAFAADDAAKAAEPAYSKKGADTCLGCHDDEVTLAVFHGKHGQPADARSGIYCARLVQGEAEYRIPFAVSPPVLQPGRSPCCVSAPRVRVRGLAAAAHERRPDRP